MTEKKSEIPGFQRLISPIKIVCAETNQLLSNFFKVSDMIFTSKFDLIRYFFLKSVNP